MKNKGLIIGLAVLIGVLISVFGVLILTNQIDFQKGDKDIAVTVVYEDKSEKTFEISTDAEKLGQALFEEGLVFEEEYKTGYYQHIDGVRADYTLDGAWWCVTKSGEMTTVGTNDLPISDGDSFEITHTPA